MSNTRVLKFGARKPHLNWDLAMTQHRKRVSYWNVLTAMYRENREQKETLSSSLKEQGLTKDQIYKENPEMLGLQQFAKDERKRLRREAAKDGLFHSGYMEVEKAMDSNLGKIHPPRFHSFDPTDGKVNFLFTNGLEEANLYGESNSIQIEKIELPAHASKATIKANPHIIRVRIGSDPSSNRIPIMVEFKAFLHREIPKETSIRDAALVWRKEGEVIKYSLHLTVKSEEDTAPTTKMHRVGLNIGWKKLEHGLRVAYWRGSDGQHGEIIVPNAWLERWDYATGIESVRAKHLNTIKEVMMAYFRTAVDVPEELKERVKTVSQWESAKRFISLYFNWRNHHRFHADDAGFLALEAWWKRHEHLGYGENTMARLMRNRTEMYRNIASQLSKCYGEIVMDKLDLREFAELEKQGKDLYPTARLQRVQASPSTLRGALGSAFSREGANILWIAARTTGTCHHCQSIEIVKAGQFHTCCSCGTKWDVDDNAARNLLSSVGAEPKTRKSRKRPVKEKVDILGESGPEIQAAD